MLEYQNISNLITKLRFSNHPTQYFIIKKISDVLLKANKLDMEELLETVVNVTDFDVQVKLFSLLSAYLISNGKHFASILTCTRLYDKLTETINQGISQRTTTSLNLISSLLYVDDDCDMRRRELTLYAQNMLRVSGCLTTMGVLFCNTMLYKDTWKSLCRALAECCRGCEQNQLHCSHVIPVCIQKLRQQHIDVFLVLLSCLQNNVKNINVFLQANGVSVFTREFLQLDLCLQLLNSIVEQSLEAVHQIQGFGILNILRDLLKAYGSTSQIGQWATVILFHVDVQLKRNPDHKSISEEINESPNETKLQYTNIFSAEKVPQNKDDTGVLLTNIVNEIHSWQSQSQINNCRFNSFQNAFKQNLHIQTPNRAQQIKTTTPRPQTNYFDKGNRYNNEEMSFSFIDNQIQRNHIRLRSDNYASMLSETTNRYNASRCITKEKQQTKTISTYQPSLVQDNSLITDDHRQLIYTRDFKPNLTSTPKHRQNVSIKQKSNGKCDVINTKRIERKKHKNIQNFSSMRQSKNRSMSARLLDVINESCTTVIKKFTSMFKSKQSTKDSLRLDNMSNSVSNSISNSYSFTKYMRKRDLLQEGNNSFKYESDMETSRSAACKTCNDTLVLKHKLKNDRHLKKTLKKLKLGINLYGCDFKKISKSLWPRDKYMTPSVLYHLYRKLIVKH